MTRIQLSLCIVVAIIAFSQAAIFAELKCATKTSQMPYECNENTLNVEILPITHSLGDFSSDKGASAHKLTKIDSDSEVGSYRTVAKIIFEDVINSTGWSFVSARSASGFHDNWQMYSAGYLEGYITADRITESLIAQNQSMFNNSDVTYDQAHTWMNKQQKWMLQKVSENPNDAFWRAIGLSHRHILGMQDGYTAALKKQGKPVQFDLVFWNQRADIEDVLTAIGPETGHQNCSMMPPELFQDYERRTSHCSVRLSFIKTPTGQTDFAVAHNTWDDYRSMLRSWKNYIFPIALPLTQSAAVTRNRAIDTPESLAASTKSIDWLTSGLINKAREEFTQRKLMNTFVYESEVREAMEQAAVSKQGLASGTKKVSQAAHRIAARIREKSSHITMFSSYPGLIQSIDDFYMLPRVEQRLIVTETTNSICNGNLYKKIVPTSLMTWHRVVATNMIAQGGVTWTKLAMIENSGTYNNQFMVIDAKYLPDVSTSKPEDFSSFAWIVEQYPGGFVRESIGSHIYKNLGWSSYNRPYFKNVFEIMGFSEAQAAYGDYYSYDKTPRALLFARETANPEEYSLSHLKKLMRFNKFQTDPISKGDPTWALASRYDLLPRDAEYFGLDGAIDAKITSVRLMGGRVGADAVASNDDELVHAEAAIISSPTYDDQTAFSWAPYPEYLRPGIPTVMNFDWVTASLPANE